MHTLPIVEVNKCLLAYELIVRLEKKNLWTLTDTERCERCGGKLAYLKPTYLLSERNGVVVEPDLILGMPFIDPVDWAGESGNSLRICFHALPL